MNLQATYSKKQRPSSRNTRVLELEHVIGAIPEKNCQNTFWRLPTFHLPKTLRVFKVAPHVGHQHTHLQPHYYNLSVVT